MFGTNAVGPQQSVQPGAQPTNPSVQKANQTIQEAKNVMQSIVDSSNVIGDNEGIGQRDLREIKGQKQETRNMPTKSEIQTQQKIQESVIASLIADQEIEKKKKKKSKFEEEVLEKKMLELDELAEAMETKQLSDEEKQIVEEFLKNSQSIKNKKRQLQQLDEKEEYYLELLEKQQEREQREKEKEKEKDGEVE